MIYSDLVNQVLRAIDEYSKKGTAVSPAKVADYKLKIPDAINEIQQDLANTTGPLPAAFTVISNPINTVNTGIKNYLPDTSDEDKEIARVKGARAYYLEAAGSYDIYIEEEIAGTWTTLVELTPVTPPAVFTALSGLLTPSATTNYVRIRLAGNYVYPVRNYVLYPYTFPTVGSIPSNKPYVEYSLPVGFLKLDRVSIRNNGSSIPFSGFKLTDSYFLYDRTVTGEIVVNYYRKPTAIVVIDPTSPSTAENAQTIDVVADAQYFVPSGVAGKILMVDNPTASVELLNYYEARKTTLTPQRKYDGVEKTIDVYGGFR